MDFTFAFLYHVGILLLLQIRLITVVGLRFMIYQNGPTTAAPTEKGGDVQNGMQERTIAIFVR